MNKPIRYILAVCVCLIIWGTCIALMVYTGIGGILAMFIMFLTIKRVWRAIIDYDAKNTDDSLDETNSQTKK